MSNKNNMFHCFSAFQLTCAVQPYAWGKIGENSEVAQLSQNGDTNFKLDVNSPYAEVAYLYPFLDKTHNHSSNLRYWPVAVLMFAELAVQASK